MARRAASPSPKLNPALTKFEEGEGGGEVRSEKFENRCFPFGPAKVVRGMNEKF